MKWKKKILSTWMTKAINYELTIIESEMETKWERERVKIYSNDIQTLTRHGRQNTFVVVEFVKQLI